MDTPESLLGKMETPTPVPQARRQLVSEEGEEMEETQWPMETRAAFGCPFKSSGFSTVSLCYSKEKELIAADKVSNRRNIGCHLYVHCAGTIDGQFNKLKSRKFICCASSGSPGAEEYGLVNESKTIVSWIKAVFAFTRPYACLGAFLGVASSSLMAIESLSDISLPFLISLLKVAAVFGCMSCYSNGVNQIFDIEIDKINKPLLPLASGEMGITSAIAITAGFAIMGFTIVSLIGSKPLFWGSFLYFLIYSGYSVNLPFLRWKKREITAALSIIANRGLVLQISTFFHMQTFVLGRQANFSRPLILGSIVLGMFSTVIALFKDIPDVEGDRKHGIRSLAAQIGQKQVFWICICLLELAYTLAIVFGATSPLPWSKAVTMLSHAALGLILWKKTESVDLKDKSSLGSFYLLVWKLFFSEFFLLPLAR